MLQHMISLQPKRRRNTTASKLAWEQHTRLEMFHSRAVRLYGGSSFCNFLFFNQRFGGGKG